MTGNVTDETGVSVEEGGPGLAPEGGIRPLWQRQRERILWTVAGFDPSGGAGITADLMTFAAHGSFGCSAITALTVQSTRGVFGWEPVSAAVLSASLERLAEDLPPVGVKIGMLGTTEAARVIAGVLHSLRREASARPIVVLDPVLRSSSGRALFPEAGLRVLQETLLPEVDWVTPNRGELALLAGQPVLDLPSAEAAGHSLMQRHPGLGVVVTGGDEEQPTELLLLPGGRSVVFEGKHIETTSTHGTGCAFSSAMLSQLAAGAAPEGAVGRAKAFVEGALRHAPGLGAGRGPLALLWPLRGVALDTLGE